MMIKTSSKYIKIGVALFSFLGFSNLALADFKNIDCEKDKKILGISIMECQVLESLWTDTHGENWQEHKNWDTLSKVSTWEGIQVESGKITSLYLYSNNLEGMIPQNIGKLSALKKLSLANNKLTGKIPVMVGALSKLDYLDLSNNHLTGTLPSTIGFLSNLTELYLNNNALRGVIPQSLGNLSKLQVLKMYHNNFSGHIPYALGSLSRLEVFSLSENNLTGTIPSTLGRLSFLTYLSLESNSLTGKIPLELGNLKKLRGLYLQNNNLEGTIPSSLGGLFNLTDLDLEHNNLSETIPVSLGDLSNLRYLNVANNQLKGTIPSELLNLTILNYLNLEGNQFVYSDIESIYTELCYIPDLILSSRMSKESNITAMPIINSNTKEKNKIIIDILTDDELAVFEVATVKLVGTDEYGDSLTIKGEGVWSIEDDKIVFTAFENFTKTPKSVFYTIENNEGVSSSPIEISIKERVLDNHSVNVLGKKADDASHYFVKLLLPNSTFISDNKVLTIESEGSWKVDDNGTISFEAIEGFLTKPTAIEYKVFKENGEILEIGMIETKNSFDDEHFNQENSVELFGLKGVFFAIFFGAIFGIFYIRELENKKL